VERFGFGFSLGVGLLLAVLYAYQFFYIFVSLVKRPRTYPKTDQTRRYAVVIAARNEENVLPALLKTLREQTYPRENFRVFVVADHCTDGTADVARASGATVLRREGDGPRGKGHALNFLLSHIARTEGLRAYHAYLFFDADNLLRPNFLAEMDKASAAGERIVTCYRNSKNYGTNWISAGYGLWFLRESRHLNNPRALLGVSAAISGTGFLVDAEIIEKNGGWRHFLLTEDIEFTVDSVLHGERVGYCHAAELFDEQPETFKQSYWQRKRWAKGFFQVFYHYGGRLFLGALRLRWSCIDLLLSILPAFLLSLIQLATLTVLLILNWVRYGWFSAPLLGCIASFFTFAYVLLLAVGAVTLVTERRSIHCSKGRAVRYLFSFPIFMMTYIPISLAALFSHVEWRPIEHKHVTTVSEIEGGKDAPKNSQK
jgi:cellulose synthase/poly-beta-1,6-N-acetylglucosamine synthase-like glycosyltransferase